MNKSEGASSNLLRRCISQERPARTDWIGPPSAVNNHKPQENKRHPIQFVSIAIKVRCRGTWQHCSTLQTDSFECQFDS